MNVKCRDNIFSMFLAKCLFCLLDLAGIIYEYVGNLVNEQSNYYSQHFYILLFVKLW